MTNRFNIEEATRARDEAIDRAERNASGDWKHEALAAVARLSRNVAFFTTDDVWACCYGTETHEPRAMGAVMRYAANLGLIEATDRTVQSTRVACHRRPVRIWASLIWKPKP